MHQDDLHTIAQEHNSVVALERLTHHIARIREAQDRTEKSVSQIADALTRLAIVEERQSNTSGALDRLAKAIEKLDDRLNTLEDAAPVQRLTSDLVGKIVWAAVGAGTAAVVAKALGMA